MNVENFSRRDKIMFNTKLGLRYDTSPDQMRYVLAQVRRLLYEHPKVETNGARSRFISFDQSALTLEIFSYVLTRDYNEFLAIQEDLLLRIMETVEAAGAGFSFPSRTVYLGRDSGVDKEKAEQVAGEVQKWRENSLRSMEIRNARKSSAACAKWLSSGVLKTATRASLKRWCALTLLATHQHWIRCLAVSSGRWNNLPGTCTRSIASSASKWI